MVQQFDPEGKQRGIEDYFDYLSDVGWRGYTRAHGVGNNDVRPCPSPLPAEHYVDAWIAARTIAALDRHRAAEAGRPFFVWMSSPKPHSPYDPPRPYDRLYDARTLPPPFGSAADLSDRNPSIDATRYGHAIPSLSPEAWQVIRSMYYGNITFLDAQVGRVLAHLDRLGLRRNTIVLFTSDHGDLLIATARELGDPIAADAELPVRAVDRSQFRVFPNGLGWRWVLSGPSLPSRGNCACLPSLNDTEPGYGCRARSCGR